MSEFSASARRYTAVLYAVIAAYFWYLFYSLWMFLAQNYFPQSISSVLSLQNNRFHLVHILVASVLTFLVLSILAFIGRLREYLLDVGDELSRVSWPSMREAQKSTALVVVIVLIAGLALFLADTFFLKVVNFIMSSAA